MEFRFRRKFDKFIWSNGQVKVVFEQPSIQAHNEYTVISTMKEVCYFYYVVNIYHKTCNAKENSTWWKKFVEISVDDFPTLPSLPLMIDDILCDEGREYAIHRKIRDNKEYLHKTFHISSGHKFAQDIYELTKYVLDYDNNKVFYKLFIGQGDVGQQHSGSIGIVLDYLSEEEIISLRNCVNAFLNYAIQMHNKKIKKYNDVRLSNHYYTNDNKVYEIEKLEENETNTKLSSIFVVGDIFSDIVCVEKENGIYSKSYQYRNVTLTQVREQEIVVVDCLNKSNIIPYSTIVEMFDEIPNTRLFFNKQEVIDDFYSILSSKEREEFATKSEEYLYYIYRNPIINRSWLCRSEHGFLENERQYCESNQDKGINLIVKDIIKELKEKCHN